MSSRTYRVYKFQEFVSTIDVEATCEDEAYEMAYRLAHNDASGWTKPKDNESGWSIDYDIIHEVNDKC